MQTSQALSQQRPYCAPRTEILKGLYDKYGEMIAYRGLDASGGMMEWTLNRETETWTVVITGPGGRSCIITSGEAWRGLREEAQGPKT